MGLPNYPLSVDAVGSRIEPDAKRTGTDFVDVTLTTEISTAWVAEGPTS